MLAVFPLNPLPFPGAPLSDLQDLHAVTIEAASEPEKHVDLPEEGHGSTETIFRNTGKPTKTHKSHKW